ncbi:MAG: class I SAM-dependent methyltransferase [Candidatus Aenigmarchaeota archaeon]|nr:class I SAM-dependent methyltransferase [Candidatus Aenigmarchaeota archaeon]
MSSEKRKYRGQRIFLVESPDKVQTVSNEQAYAGRAKYYWNEVTNNPNEMRAIELTDDFFYFPWGVREVKENRAACLLDIGCGTGHRTDRFQKEMRKHNPEFWANGCDVSPHMVEIARKTDIEYGKGPVDAKVCDMKHLDYDSGLFDIASIMYTGLSHVRREEVPHALAEIRRVIKPGGILLLDVPLFKRNSVGHQMVQKMIDLGHMEAKDPESWYREGKEWPEDWREKVDPFRYLVYRRAPDSKNFLYLYRHDSRMTELVDLLREQGYMVGGDMLVYNNDMRPSYPPPSIASFPARRRDRLVIGHALHLLAIAARKG